MGVLTIFWGSVGLPVCLYLVNFYMSKYLTCVHVGAPCVCLWLVMSYGCLCTDGVYQGMDMDVGASHRTCRALDIERHNSVCQMDANYPLPGMSSLTGNPMQSGQP